MKTIIFTAALTAFISTDLKNASAFSVTSIGHTKGPIGVRRNNGIIIPHAQSDTVSEDTIPEVKDDSKSSNNIPTAKIPENTTLRRISSSTPSTTLLKDVMVTSVKNGEPVELSSFLTSSSDKVMITFGTYAADFNAIEYAQRLRYYLPQLEERGITKIGLVLNCEAEAAKTMVEMVDLPTDATSDSPTVELFIDPEGKAGRVFGVGRGWREDDDSTSPYLKLFGMLFGLGAWATLPAVIGGYIGNPFLRQPWIEDAIAVGQRQGRWPSTALDLDEETGEIISNKFRELPVVGGWERRPLELATLRLQNMVDISIKNWGSLAPSEESLDAGVLTQLGGCVVMDSETGEDLYQWRDPGICAVANFEDILLKIPLN